MCASLRSRTHVYVFVHAPQSHVHHQCKYLGAQYYTAQGCAVQCYMQRCTALCTALYVTRQHCLQHFTPPHSAFQVLGGLGIVVYLVGFPLMIVLALRHISKHKLHCNKETIALWGVLYTKYEPLSWW